MRPIALVVVLVLLGVVATERRSVSSEQGRLGIIAASSRTFVSVLDDYSQFTFEVGVYTDAAGAAKKYSEIIDLSDSTPGAYTARMISFGSYGDASTAIYIEPHHHILDGVSSTSLIVRSGRFVMVWAAVGIKSTELLFGIMAAFPEDPEADLKASGDGNPDVLLPGLSDLPVGFTLKPGQGTPVA